MLSRARRLSDSRGERPEGHNRETSWRIVIAGPVIGIGSMLIALIAVGAAGVPLRDPDQVASMRMVVVFVLVAVLIAVDIVVRASRVSGQWRRPSLAELARTRRERWTARRLLVVALAILSFFATYLAYRNLKSVVPLLRPGDLFDAPLLSVDRWLLGGNDPADVLQNLLGTNLAAHGMSFVYMLLFMFIPASMSVALVFSSDLRGGLFFTTALSTNWLIGAGSYFLLPSLGPVYDDPAAFVSLPYTTVTHLQNMLLDERSAFLASPHAAGAAQSIGAFASLHASIYFTAALCAHLLGIPRPIKVTLWILTGLTLLSTVYFGWHYILDDVGGLGIAVASLALARGLTGFQPATIRRLRSSPRVLAEPA